MGASTRTDIGEIRLYTAGMRCVLIGNYGAHNLGDEALRQYFLSAFADVQWIALSAHPTGAGEVPRLPLGLRSFFTAWWRTIAAIRRSDAVVFGGGSLFTDSESVFACVLWWWHGFVACLCGKPVLLAFQGLGPFHSSVGRFFARRTFERAAFISVRDEKSLERVSVWKLRTNPVLTFDPVFKVFSAYKRTQNPKRILAIIPRANSGEQFFVALSGKLASGFDEIRILLMQPEEERGVADRIVTMTHKNAGIVEIRSVDQLCSEIGAASEVLAQRYHGALAAIAIGVPVMIIEQVEGDKLQALRPLSGDSSLRGRSQDRVRDGESALRQVLLPL